MVGNHGEIMRDISGLSGKKLGYVVGWISIITNIVFFALKMWVGLAVSSVAMIADAWHTIYDSLTSVIVVAGFWASGKPADFKHPFGHGRIEAIAGIIIGTLLGVVGFKFLYSSVSKLVQVQAMLFRYHAVYIFAGSAIVKELLARCSIWAGRKAKLVSLVADGWHHRSDAIASGFIVAGIFMSPWFWWVDGVLGILVSLFILYTAFIVVRESSSGILGEELDAGAEEKIRRAIGEAVPEKIAIHHFHMHRYGGHAELTFHIRISPETHIIKAHTIADIIEKKLKDDLDIDATVHVEPGPVHR